MEKFKKETKGKLVVLKAYDNKWLADWCREELAECARDKSIFCCQNCLDYGICAIEPIRVILKRLEKKKPLVMEALS